MEDWMQILITMTGILLVIEILRWHHAAVSAWWYQRLHKELRDCAPWADPRKVRRVYREEMK